MLLRAAGQQRCRLRIVSVCLHESIHDRFSHRLVMDEHLAALEPATKNKHRGNLGPVTPVISSFGQPAD